MTVEHQIAYWRKQHERAETKEAAILAFGVMVGLMLAAKTVMD